MNESNVEDIASKEQVEELIENQSIDEQVITYTKEDIDSLQSQINELSKYKPKELSDKEKILQDKQLKLWQKEVSLTLKENNLEDFAEFILIELNDVDGLNEKITRLNGILGKRELSDSYKPANHRANDKYSIAEKKKDTKGMIGSKLSNLFK